MDLSGLSDIDLLDLYQFYNKKPRIVDQFKFSYSTKFAYHIIRLLNEVEQILTEGDLDLQRNREQLKSIRRGEWTANEIEEYFKEKEKSLEEVYTKSELPWGPDVDSIRKLLFECLEMHYDLSETIVVDNKAEDKLNQIQKILDR